tara:strand:+ start:6896 stop:7066 length:171 start_codon:yes stop_codon:yes gene_type:complete
MEVLYHFRNKFYFEKYKFIETYGVEAYCYLKNKKAEEKLRLENYVVKNLLNFKNNG